MAVLVLMYHRTPRDEVTSDLDTPMVALRDQVHGLSDAGFRFIGFKDAIEERYYTRETFVSLTFDDGHESNLDAIDFLHAEGVPATTFIISDFSRNGHDGFMTTKAIADAGQRCEWGGHGATHADLTSLSPNQLEQELRASKAYIEDTVQRTVTTMSAPGGRIDGRVTKAAVRCGYRAIGSTAELMNFRPSTTLNRICVRLGDKPQNLIALAGASRLYWARRQARRTAVTLVSKSLERLSPSLLDRLRRSRE